MLPSSGECKSKPQYVLHMSGWLLLKREREREKCQQGCRKSFGTVGGNAKWFSSHCRKQYGDSIQKT